MLNVVGGTEGFYIEDAVEYGKKMMEKKTFEENSFGLGEFSEPTHVHASKKNFGGDKRPQGDKLLRKGLRSSVCGGSLASLPGMGFSEKSMASGRSETASTLPATCRSDSASSKASDDPFRIAITPGASAAASPARGTGAAPQPPPLPGEAEQRRLAAAGPTTMV